MRIAQTPAVEAAFAQPLTEELLACAGIGPGMRVLVLGADLPDLALLVAERVGRTGTVIGLDAELANVDRACARAEAEGFERIEFRIGELRNLHLEAPVDAVVGRFFLMSERDPAEAIRRAAGLVHDGGRLVFQEWHYDSMLWPQTSDWPHVPLYRRFAQWSIETMRDSGVRVDMGLRLVNLFTEAGLPLPGMRSDFRIIAGPGSLGYTFFESAIRELQPASARRRAAGADLDAESFAERLENETTAARGHLFLPLQIGAWTRVSVREGFRAS
ncbi:MAG TPA: methyltransferase domain-containing protein [Candidatus Cybelea sp.]|jgi:SAM-dependent methyltransferase|nr:methyltransferase domain-containing protein [Candidatus Cybelea sp.]